MPYYDIYSINLPTTIDTSETYQRLPVDKELFEKLDESTKPEITKKNVRLSKSGMRKAKAEIQNQENLKEVIDHKKETSLCVSGVQVQKEINPELLDILIKYGNNPEGIPVLHYAVKMQDINAVRLLLAHGANVNTRDAKLNKTPIHIASEIGNVDLINLLLDKGADIFAVDVNDMNVFHYAILSDNSRETIYLLRKNVKDTSLVNSLATDFLKFGGISPLAGACLLAKNESIVALVECGAKINEVNDQGYTILSWAAYNCNEKTIKFLINNGAIYEKRCITSNPRLLMGDPIYCALDSGNYAALKFFLEMNPKSSFNEKERAHLFASSLYKVSSNYSRFNNHDKFNCMKLMIDLGFFSTEEAYGSLSNSFPEAIDFLLENRFININQKFNEQPLLMFFIHGHEIESFEISRMLIEKGADVNIRNMYNQTPLHYAAESYNPKTIELIKMLIDKGANINAVDQSNHTPLFFARNNLKIRNYLISLGAKE